MTCASCGFANPAGFKFCGNCAASLTEAPPASAPAPRDLRAYTPKHLVEKILVSRSAIEGERKQVSVLFADVVRSMELAEQVDAEEWHGILDRFFALLADGVHRFEGTINQFTGDGIMALFGAPLAHEDHAQRACYAALYLSEVLRRYGEEVKRTSGLGFSVRMGINSGEVVVGKIGDDLRMDYTAQGHTVGLAARMEQLAGPDRVYVTEHTAALVSGFFRLRDLGRFDVKGSREPIGVHELEGVGTLRTRLDVSRARGFSRFVGRTDELEALEAALARVLAGDGLVIGVSGDAGVGKSRLCHELVSRCRARGILVAEAHAQPHGKSVPYLPWIAQLREYIGVTDQDTDEAARDKIAGRLLRLDESLVDSLPIVFDFLGVPDPARPVPPMDPEARQRRFVDIMSRMARARSRREVAAVFLHEDLHWIDRGSEALLAANVEIVAETRSLIVVTFRPDYRAAWMTSPAYREIALRPLGGTEVEALLDGLVGRDPSVGELGARIRERAAGNPFFVEEIVQSLVEAGALAGPRGAYRLEKPVESIEIPPTVHSILAARIDRLEERQKAILEIAAVVGRSFSEPILERVVEGTVEELRGVLDGLVTAELVRPSALFPVAEYAFKHPLTQEVAYRSQLADRRARTHGAVARAIAEVHAGRLEERAALLAHHFEAADERLEAARWSRRAARWLRSNNLTEALAHWRNVLRLLAELPESPEVVALSLEARSAALQSGWVLGIAEEEAAALFEESRALAVRAGDTRSLALFTAYYAGIQSAHRHVDEYVRSSFEAVRLAEETGDPALQAAVWPSLVRALLITGRMRDGLELADRALATMPENARFGTLLGYSPYLNLLQLRANLLGFAGRWREAAAEFERMIEIASRLPHPVLVDSASSDYAWWAALFGDAPTALRLARRGLEVAEKLGNQLTRVYAYGALGVAENAAGRRREAIDALEQARRIAKEVRTGQESVILTLAHLAEAHLGEGDGARARDLADAAVAEAREHRVPSSECFASLVRARVRLAVGGAAEATEAAAAIERGLALAEETGARCYEPFFLVERARLASIKGDSPSSERDRAAAHALFEEMGVDADAPALLGRFR